MLERDDSLGKICGNLGRSSPSFCQNTPFPIYDAIYISQRQQPNSYISYCKITVMPHPPRSPDLNRSAVVSSAQREWEEGQELTQSLVSSMPRRLNSVLTAGGGYTLY